MDQCQLSQDILRCKPQIIMAKQTEALITPHPQTSTAMVLF